MELLSVPVFSGVSEGEYEEIKALAHARRAAYQKGGTIFRTGERVSEIGVVLSGSVNIESVDLWGNRSILSNIPAGQIFGETYALCGAPMMVDAVAAEDSAVVFLALRELLSRADPHAAWYPKLMRNLLMTSASRNMVLTSRIFCTSSKHIRSRVMTYLSSEAVKCGRREFTIPFDRQQMADYLNVERSALSKELGRMRRDGILTYRKNRFCLCAVE